jgi:hypothetical protein
VTILIVGVVLLGAVLGRFFRVWILIPTGAAAVVAALAGSILHGAGIFGVLSECAVVLTCLQIGYATGVFSRPLHSAVKQGEKCRAVPPAGIAASRHRHFF